MASDQAQTGQKFIAIVLAGSRGPSDPVAEAAGVRAKALAEIGGIAMVSRVIAALATSESVSEIVVVGLSGELPADVEAVLAARSVRRVMGAETPSRSVIAALEKLDSAAPVLVTTADHALLQSEYVDEFCGGARTCGADVAIALATHQKVLAASPDTRRTVSRFSDGEYCGCNLFAFMTQRGRDAVGFWRRVEAHRKNPVRVIRSLGLFTLLRFVSGRLSLSQGLGALSRRSGATVAPVLMKHGEAAIDVDSAEDLRRVRAMVAAREPG